MMKRECLSSGTLSTYIIDSDDGYVTIERNGREWFLVPVIDWKCFLELVNSFDKEAQPALVGMDGEGDETQGQNL